MAAERREELLAARTSFVTETVFSHESKVDLVKAAAEAGYLVTLHVVLVPEDLAVARVGNRVENDGHDVPEEKVRSRYARLWPLVAKVIALVDEATVYDNSSAPEPFRVVASFSRGVAGVEARLATVDAEGAARVTPQPACAVADPFATNWITSKVMPSTMQKNARSSCGRPML